MPASRRLSARALALGLFGLGICGLAVLRTPTANAAPAQTFSAILAGPQRTDAERARDVYRHPTQTLTFFGIKPNQTVIEVEPGAGWYTEILAPYLHDSGKLYVAPYFSDSAKPESAGNKRYREKLAQDPALYGNVEIGALRAGRFSDVAPEGSVDLVVTFRNVHNWMKDGHIDDNFKAFYAELKPGGVLGIEDHRAKPGTSDQQMIATGYLTEAYVIQHARAAGFTLAGSSEINSNPRDTKDYPRGVWTLPPTLVDGDQDRAKYLAIGESDRMTLRFVKAATAPGATK
jgi:predicted methyltransferase